MATRNVKIDIELSTKNQKKVLKDVKDIHDQVKATQQAASSGIGLAAASATSMQVTGTDYRRARGLSEVTGASARDFARQSQGLGGLVRLYATYAANVFAVTAAFQGLSQAMNTENMIRGLNQLSAASGQALGNLAQQFVSATGGAISLRESMEATTKAISSGLNQEQFLQLGQVATKASQALGINMSDAVSRLTRGITKLEPELLDELGIFTKLDKAVSDYSLKVGKSANSLTDFERRQAFANAVLAEGLEKFGNIQIDVNPYDKLLATLRNVSQTILSLVNTALGPLINLLSSSPVALTTILTALGVNLLKNVLPILGQFKTSLKETADEASNLAQQRAQQAQQALAARRTSITSGLKAELDRAADEATESLVAAERKFEQATKGTLQQRARSRVEEVKKILAEKDIDKITDQQIAKIRSYGAALKNQNNIYNQLADTLDRTKRAHQDYYKVVQQEQNLLAQPVGKYTVAGLADESAKKAQQRASRLNLILLSAEETKIDGARQAWKNLNQGIKTEGLSAGQSALTRIGGAATIAATRLATFASAFAGVGVGILAAIGIYQIFESILGKNSAQVQQFNATIDELETSVKTATDTTKKFNGVLSEQSIIAISTAYEGLTNNIGKLISDLETADKKANWFDRLSDNFKRVFGQDLRTGFAKNMRLGINQAVETIDDPVLKQRLESQLKSLFKGTGTLAENIEKTAQTTEPEKLFDTFKNVESILKNINKEYAKQKQFVLELQDANKDLDKTYRELFNTFISTDPGTKFAVSAIKQLDALVNLLGQTRTESIGLKNVVDSLATSVFLPVEAKSELQTLQGEYNQLQIILKELQQPLKIVTDNLGLPGPAKMGQFNRMRGTDIFPDSRISDTARQQLLEYNNELNNSINKHNELLESLNKVKTSQQVNTDNINSASTQLNEQTQALTKSKAMLSDYTQELTVAKDKQEQLKSIIKKTADIWQQDNILPELDAGNIERQIRTFGPAGSQMQTFKNDLKEVTNLISYLQNKIKQETSVAQGISQQIDNLTNSISKLNSEGENLSTLRNNLTLDLGSQNLQIKQLTDNITKLTSNLKSGFVPDATTIKSLKDKMEDIIKAVTNQVKRAAAQAVEFIVAPLDRAIKQSQITIQKTLLQGVPTAPETIQLSLDLETQSINLRRQEIQRLGELINSNERLRLATEIQTTKMDLVAQSFDNNPEIERNLRNRLTELEAEQKVLNAGRGQITQARAALAQPTALARTEGLAELGMQGPGALQQLTRRIGEEVKLEELATQERVANINATVAAEKARLDIQIKNKQALLDQQKSENERYFASAEFNALAKNDQENTRRSLELSMQAQQNALQTEREGVQVAALRVGLAQAQQASDVLGAETAARIVGIYRSGISQLETQNNHLRINRDVELQARNTTFERTTAQQRIVEALDQEQQLLKSKNAENQVAAKTTLDMLGFEERQLEIQRNQGVISEDQFNALNRQLQTRKILLESYVEELSVKQEIAEKDVEMRRELAAAPEGDAEKIRARYQTEITALQQKAGAILLVRDARLREAASVENLSARQKSYDQIFSNSFSSMADAIVSWAQTGKWAGKDLFNSLLADLARYELKLQTMMLYQTAIRPFLLSLLPGAGATAGAGAAPEIDYFGSAIQPQLRAKGAAYFAGIERFAKGGMFTNQIVDSPTLFKFARGTGLMGEAGPEAIMPLKRDSQGNLGVRANQTQQKTEVVINNYSQSQATAQESVDSRGNRRIEVIIGEAASSEMSRSGSQSQQTMKNTFGLRPQLIRR